MGRSVTEEPQDLVQVDEESGLPVIAPGQDPPDGPCRWIDEKTGWIFQRTKTGKVVKHKATKAQQFEDIMRLRLLRADSTVTRKDVAKRTGWTVDYINRLVPKLKGWEEANIANATKEAVVARALTLIEKEITGLHEVIADNATTPGVKVRAYGKLGEAAERMMKLLQETGIIPRAPKQLEMRGAILHTDDPEELKNIGQSAAEFNQRYVNEDGEWVNPLKDVIVIEQEPDEVIE